MSGFRTKLDFSDNRQAKQRPITRTVLSGGTSFGLPFNLLPSGPNLTTSAITGNYTYIASTFSGNNTTTVYNWSDPRMQLGVSALSALTSSTSGLTQNTGAVWTANTTTVIDGNTVALTYSGVNFDISVVTIAQLTPSTYSGTITTNNFDVYTASTLAYTGRTIWVDVSGITRTEKLIITKNPQVGYVWTCLDSEGMGAWQYNGTGSTVALVWTAGTNNASAVLSGSNSTASGQYSVAEGNLTIASGNTSHAEGYQTQANGYASHAEGGNTRANGDYSHAEGFGDTSGITTASGVASHAEGHATFALGDYSHAQNDLTFTSGIAAHAEGYGTIASGNTSHAQGRQTIAIGESSHAGGHGSKAGGDYSFVHFFGDPFDINIGASGYSSSILGGRFHTITSGSAYSVVIGGDNNKISGSSISSGIFVGTANTISNNSKHAAIIAGMNNTISGHSNSVIVGGSYNFIDFCLNNYGTSANETIIGGGGNQMYTADNSFIAGGILNLIDGRTAGIGSDSSFVIGSFQSSAFTSNNSGILGGWRNAILSSDCSFITNTLILGGEENIYNPYGGAGVGSGSNNIILGGSNNKLSGSSILKSAIIGGNNNGILANTVNSVVIGGAINTIDTAEYSIIVGGSGNTVTKNTDNLTQPNHSGIFAGKNNTIIPRFGSVSSQLSASYCAIVGGELNTISGHSHSFIGGGYNNLIACDGRYNAIIGGYNNINHAANGVVIGGVSNTLGFSTSCPSAADNSIILGGNFNKIALTSNNTFNTAIIGGVSNLIDNTLGDVDNTVIIGGSNITATTSYTVYVPNMIINTGGTASKLGINTKTPEYVIDARANNARLVLADIYTGDDLPFKSFVFSANSTNVPQIVASTSNYTGGFGLGLAMGVVGNNSISTATSELVGLSGDTYLSSSQKTNNLNIINRSGGSGTNNIRMYAGLNSVSAASVPDFQIQGNGATRGYIGIQTGNPQYLIDARGTGNRLFYSSTGVGSITLSATTGLPSVGVVAGTANTANNLASISMGARAWNDTTYTVYGYPGDSFIYAGIFTNGLNIISNDGSTSGTGADYIRFYAGQTSGAGASNNPDLHIQGSGSSRGYVAINVPHNQDPTQRLDVNGNARFRGVGSSASAGALHYTSDGTLTTNTSDERLKTNIETLTNALDKVNQLRGVKYNWTEEPNGDVRIGLIAQEVNSIVPELTFVNKNTEEEYMGVHYDNVVALLIEAVKELSSGVTTSNNTHLETQTILAEDNNIELNFNGTQETSLGGGLSVLHAKGQDQSADLITDANGNFITNNDFKPNALTIPLYTPTSSNDTAGSEGNITRDDNYMYVKTSTGWKRTNLENF